ncbi:MAG: MarR family transcriptional regulator [Gemmatimonadaceae bacterium]|nr:MarR family transcriptional regulator [Gemmatimonadaceae bacterium]
MASNRRRERAQGRSSAARVADRLHSSAIHLLRRLRTEDRRTGLSGPRASALSVVVFGGPLTLGELAAAEQVKPPTMTRLITALEERGLVTRESDASDARLVLVRATGEGIRLLQEGRARRIARLQVALEGLDDARLATLDEATAILGELLPQV